MKTCDCEKKLMVKDIDRKRKTCIDCREREISKGTLTLGRYRHLKIAKDGNYTTEKLPQADHAGGLN